MAWKKEQPTDSLRLSEVPQILRDNLAAIEDWTEVEHYSIDPSASSANSGAHIPGSASVAYEGTTTEIAAISPGASGAVAFNTTTGQWEKHSGTVWQNCRQTYWPRARYYFGENTAIALTANKMMFVASAIGVSKDYDLPTASPQEPNPVMWLAATSAFASPESGCYMVGCTLAFCAYKSGTGASALHDYTLSLKKNGSHYCQVDDRRWVVNAAGTHRPWTLSLHRLMMLDKDDEVTFYCSASVADMVFSSADSAWGDMYIHRIGGPTF